MEVFRADLHVHTVLSPCAEVEMIPPLIVQESLARGIRIIAITDHNASANVPAVQKAAQGSGLTVLPGMEVQSREDVHLLCLFQTNDQLADWQAQVDESLPSLKNRAELFGDQFVIDETGEFIRREERMLLTSTRFSVDEVFSRVRALGGLTIPAHVDRTSYGLMPTLGLVSDAWQAEAFEISRHLTPEMAQKAFPVLAAYPLLQSGDVHMLSQFLGSVLFTLETPTLAEIRLALRRRHGRSFKIDAA
jgi:hypothetical protein